MMKRGLNGGIPLAGMSKMQAFQVGDDCFPLGRAKQGEAV